MTREGLNKNWELVEAYKNGAEIEFKNVDGVWKSIDDPVWSFCTEYRIKPTAPEYIPFDFTDAEFLIGKVIKCRSEIQVITQLNKDYVFAGVGQMDYSWLFEKYTFLDGSPCCKLKQ